MTCFTEDVDSQETETLEVDSEGEKLRREPEEQNVNLSDQSLAIIQEAYKAIAEVINLVYKILIKVDFHPQC